MPTLLRPVSIGSWFFRGLRNKIATSQRLGHKWWLLAMEGQRQTERERERRDSLSVPKIHKWWSTGESSQKWVSTSGVESYVATIVPIFLTVSLYIFVIFYNIYPYLSEICPPTTNLQAAVLKTSTSLELLKSMRACAAGVWITEDHGDVMWLGESQP